MKIKHYFSSILISLLFATFCSGAYAGTTDDLLKAIDSNRPLKYIQEILSKPNVDVNARNSVGTTALHIASQKGYFEIVKLLLAHQAKNIKHEKYGATAVHFASQNGHFEIVELLIKEANFEFDEKDKFGWTPLLLAARQGKTKIVNFLVKNGANIKERSNVGGTVLHYLSNDGFVETFEKIVKLGADVNAKAEKDQISALQVASINNQVKIVKVLIENTVNKADINQTDAYGATALMHASKRGNIEIVKYLISNQADIDIQGNQGWTALMAATKNGYVDTVRILLENGANKTLKDNSGLSAYDFAKINNQVEIAKLVAF